MSTIDIRKYEPPEIDRIVFAENKDSVYTTIAYELTKEHKRINIVDGDAYVIVTSKEHAENLIKALNKAIELGWVK